MKKMLPLVVLSFASLAWVLAAPVLFFMDVVSHAQVTLHLLIATCVWFAATPWWMGNPRKGGQPPESRAPRKGGQVKASG